MTWRAHLKIEYELSEQKRTVARHKHQGPLRVIRSMYPEGPQVCHHVIVHPPGGLVQGDCLEIDVDVAPGAHGLVSTPGATRFYRSTGEWAEQHIKIRMQAGARFEWLPLETIAYNACRARNTLNFTLDEGAELMAWDVASLGLHHAGQPFERGCLHQRMEWPGHWLEQAHIDATDVRLLRSPAGLAGHSALATLVLACGTPIMRQRREHLLAQTRAAVEASPLALQCGITCPNDHMLVARALADQVEPVMALWQTLWATLRREAWDMPQAPPRIWRV